MAVKDVFAPKPVNPTDPKNIKEKDEGKIGDWERKAKEAKATLEYVEAQKMIDRITQPEPPQEPQFKVTGGAHFDIDPQRDAREAREEAERVRKEKEAELKMEKEKREKAEGDLRKSELASMMKDLTGQFAGALKEVRGEIAEVKSGADPSRLTAQWSALEQLAEKITALRSSGGGGTDPAIQLEITKMQMDNARADREFQARMEQDRRQWELDKEKMQDDRYFKRQEAEYKQKSRDMYAGAPIILGDMIARGIRDKEAGKAGGGVGQIQAKGKTGGYIEASEGDAGEVNCAVCQQPVYIGPTARSAECSNCRTRYPIKRIAKQSVPEGEE